MFFHYYFIIYLYAFFYVCFLCVCVCGWVGVFLTGGGYVVPCSCTKDKNSIKQIVVCVVCY